MANKMLIDAAHPEETRVVVLRGNRIEEFDFEAASKRQLRGNIYLAKVTRVEPSLQAAFIEYGGNRHGFLAFSEIHPDYYQIPVADRQALLEEEARSHADEEEEPPRSSRGGGRDGGNGGGREGGREGGGNGGGREGGRDGGRRSRRHRRDGAPVAQRRTERTDEVVVGDVPAAEEAIEDGTQAPDGEHATPAEGVGHSEALTGDHPESDHVAEAHDPAMDFADEPAAVEGEAAAPAHPDEHAHHDDAALHADAPEDGDAADEETGSESHDHVTTLEHGEEASVDAQDAVEAREPSEPGHDDHPHEDDVVEQLGGDALEDVPHRVSRPRRHYKIQEVIKRRQVLLVQVVKEERGNKGAALTTYLSLAGRYSVLMPNTARGGGISRKITDPEDRKRLKAIAQELEVPDGMGIILRTAGAARGMPEVKRDFEYLMRMWETVRETTLRSSAPTLVYEEGSLIKRSIRDLFNKDVDEVIVSGDEAYREAKDFMRLLMPTHAKAVVAYRDPSPIFAKAGAEAQLDAMFSNQVTLKSGGYLVINQTEALVAIDVNSGRSTREHSIEDTALRTNLEAADEVARQLRLRDLAGLIVVDFIDMDEGRNDRAVERRIKDALKNDRARIQIGRISHFGLLEMSRQRMRTGVLEGSTVMCPHCAGSGTVRSMSSIALHVLRLIEDALIKSATNNLIVRTRSEVALYILNQKRMNLLDLESRFGVSITLLADAHMTGAVYHAIERGGDATPPVVFGRAFGAPAEVAEVEEEEFEAEEEIEEGEEPLDAIAESGGQPEVATTQSRSTAPSNGEEGEGGRRRRRRRRRRGRDGQGTGAEPGAPHAEGGAEDTGEGAEGEDFDQEELSDIASGFAPPEAEAIAEAVAAEREEHAASDVAAEAPVPVDEVPAAETALPVAAVEPDPAEANDTAAEVEPEPEAPRRRRSTRRTPRAADAEAAPDAAEATAEAAPARRSRRSRSRVTEAAPALDLSPTVEAEAKGKAAPDAEPELPLAAAPEAESPAAIEAAADPVPEAPAPAEPVEDPNRPKRSGWWQRAKASLSGE